MNGGVELQITMPHGYYKGVQLDLYFVTKRENCVELLNFLFIKPSHKKLLNYNKRHQ